MRAWRIVWTRMPPDEDGAGIYIAETAGKARAKAVRQLTTPARRAAPGA